MDTSAAHIGDGDLGDAEVGQFADIFSEDFWFSFGLLRHSQRRLRFDGKRSGGLEPAALEAPNGSCLFLQAALFA